MHVQGVKFITNFQKNNRDIVTALGKEFKFLYIVVIINTI